MFARLSLVWFVLLPVLTFSQSAPQQFIEHDTETAPGHLAMIRADLNSDSISDVVTANRDAGTVSVLRMNGDGTAADRQDFATGENPIALVAGDFNHDHKIDIVTINADPNDAHSIAVLLGNGDGTLQTPKFFSGGHLPFTMAAADFDGDGNLDVVTGWLQVTSSDPNAKQSNQIQISYGDGKGGFSSHQTFNDLGEVEPAGGFDRRMTKLAVGDFNHDGHPDLVFIEGNRTTRVGSGDFVLVLNGGSKHFTQQPPTDIEEPNEVISADVNQDGIDDIVIVTYGCTLDDGCPDADQPAVTVYTNKGNGTFTSKTVMAFGGDEFEDLFNSPSVADLDGNGLKDVAIFTLVGGNSTVGQQNGQAEMIVAFQQTDGTFVTQRFLANVPMGSPTDAAGLLFDQDRDGRMDAAFMKDNGHLAILMNATMERDCPFFHGFRGLRICTTGTTAPGVNSPVQIQAVTVDTAPIEAIKIYVDGVARFSTTDDELNTRLNIIPGGHDIVVKAWDRSGPFSATAHINVMSRCSFPGVDRTINVCSPTSGTVNSPVPVQANVTNFQGVNAIQVYVDGAVKFTSASTARSITASIPMAGGKHRVTVKAWDVNGPFSQTYTLTVQ